MINFSSMLTDGPPVPPQHQLTHHQQVSGAVTLIFVINPFGVSGWELKIQTSKLIPPLPPAPVDKHQSETGDPSAVNRPKTPHGSGLSDI